MSLEWIKRYYYNLLAGYLAVKIRKNDSAAEINPQNNLLSGYFWKLKPLIFPRQAKDLEELSPDYLVLNGNLHIEKNILSFFSSLHVCLKPVSRLIIIYYSSFFWKPVLVVATWLGIRTRMPEINWITKEDMTNFLELSGYQVISDSRFWSRSIFLS